MLFCSPFLHLSCKSHIFQCHFRISENVIFMNIASYLGDGNEWSQSTEITNNNLQILAFKELIISL